MYITQPVMSIDGCDLILLLIPNQLEYEQEALSLLWTTSNIKNKEITLF